MAVTYVTNILHVLQATYQCIRQCIIQKYELLLLLLLLLLLSLLLLISQNFLPDPKGRKLRGDRLMALSTQFRKTEGTVDWSNQVTHCAFKLLKYLELKLILKKVSFKYSIGKMRVRTGKSRLTWKTTIKMDALLIINTITTTESQR